MQLYFLSVTVFCNIALCLAEDEVATRKFPDNFLWGYASAAYQVEGAWNLDGKSENIWDHDAHYFPERFPPGQNGDIGPDCYHKTTEDVSYMKDIGVKAYRFSIAWSRILPDGTDDNVNELGVAYYKDLISQLKANGIEPLVTMHHWDIPQVLEEQGGFLNHSIIGLFVNYARVCFREFGGDVKYWATFNEPRQTCQGGYGSGGIAPQKLHPGFGGYVCSHNLLRAHGLAYKMYNEEFRASQNGFVSMVMDTAWFEPASDSQEDQDAAERMRQFQYGWYANPIVYGDYPEVMKERVALRSAQEGYASSRLPAFTDVEKEYMKDSYDYLTINMYTSNLVQNVDEPAIGSPNYWLDMKTYSYQPEEWEGTTTTSWFKVVPWGARKLLVWLKNTYGDSKSIYVTENGYHDNGTVMNDLDTRGRYHKLYLSNINDAIYKDGVNVAGYMAWSMLDDVEWYAGFGVQLGHIHVDFTSDNRTRTRKQSSYYYQQIVTTNCLVDVCDN